VTVCVVLFATGWELGIFLPELPGICKLDQRKWGTPFREGRLSQTKLAIGSFKKLFHYLRSSPSPLASQRERLMANCKHFEICGLSDDADPKEGLCILHSRDPQKDKKAFREALDANRKVRGNYFVYIFFPEEISFGEETFSDPANFLGATFSQRADFQHASFIGRVDFSGAKFNKEAIFLDVTFSERADFMRAEFKRGADFFGARFAEGGDFKEATFDGGEVIFEGSTFKGRTLFSSRKDGNMTNKVFSGAEKVNFKSVIIDPPSALTFIEADLQKCLFLDTNLGEIGFFAVDWLAIKGRIGVYDEETLNEEEEKVGRGKREKGILLVQLERLYRELKKNYEDHRDFERAGHFNYGEKEIRRRNPGTSRGLWVLLTLYWLFSGYGERWVRPLFWLLLLLASSTIGYLSLGTFPIGGRNLLSWTDISDCLTVFLYSLRVIFLLRPNDIALTGLGAKALHTLQSVLGPIFIALLALAVRQKLKR
jgi:hypothetical protein